MVEGESGQKLLSVLDKFLNRRCYPEKVFDVEMGRLRNGHHAPRSARDVPPERPSAVEEPRLRNRPGEAPKKIFEHREKALDAFDQTVRTELLQTTDFGVTWEQLAPWTEFIPLGPAGAFDSYTVYPAWHGDAEPCRAASKPPA